tara:strand:+ start:96 stop:509 length:414 start_codon:yes stop_codon:yes gene_type:complete
MQKIKLMEDSLKMKIFNLLKKENLLSFTSNITIQGGPLVDIVLNKKSIGEVCTYNSVDKRYENIPQGNLLELELAHNLMDWVHEFFFQFVCENDNLISDFYDCSFRLVEENIILEVSLQNEEERINECYKYLLTDIE